MFGQRFVKYCPEIFDARDVQQAKRIILTNEGGLDSEARWQTETPYLIELILRSFALGPDMVVLDYGCGIGRVAKAMIEVSGCSVVGLDISGSMRQLARDYVGSDRFIAVSPGQYDTMVAAGLRVNAAIAVWVLQHCLQPAEDIARIRRSIVPKGRIFVLNMSARAVPSVDGGNKFAWVQDEIDVAALLRAEFRVQAEGTPDRIQMQDAAPQSGVYWMSLRQRRS
ncbi:MAG: methyltransferase domain-containing protein [Xanthobacteraceae bacterium]